MFTSQTEIRVRYGETDKMGVVYNGNYALYFEVGRTEALRQIGITYDSIEQEGTMMPVHSMSMHFHKPAVYDEVLTIHTSFEALPSVRIKIQYDIRNINNEKVCSGETTLVFVDRMSGKPVRCPEYILKAFQPYFAQ